MLLEEAQNKFEAQFSEVRRGYKGAVLPDGTPFIVVCPGGSKPEGDPTPAVCSTEEVAVQMWLEAAQKFVVPGAILHWRVEPEFDSGFSRWCAQDGSDLPHLKDVPVKDIVRIGWVGYSRFAVTVAPHVG